MMFKRFLDLFKADFIISCSRCRVCGTAYNDLQIYKGKGCVCGSNQTSPTNPNFKEKIRIMFLYIIRGY